MRCSTRAIAILILLAPGAPASAQGLETLAGEWKNPRETRSIVGAHIYAAGGRWMVQLLGACHPTPCVWNPEPLALVSPSEAGGPPRARATFQRANMRRVMTFRLGEDALVVEIASVAAPTSRGRGFSTNSVDELRYIGPARPLTPTRSK